MLIASINVKSQNSMKSMSGIPTIGHQRMVAVVALLQCPREPHQLSLKYYQVVAQVAHQVVTTTTAPVAKVAITA
jgi:hypothetical protein